MYVYNIIIVIAVSGWCVCEMNIILYTLTVFAEVEDLEGLQLGDGGREEEKVILTHVKLCQAIKEI